MHTLHASQESRAFEVLDILSDTAKRIKDRHRNSSMLAIEAHVQVTMCLFGDSTR